MRDAHADLMYMYVRTYYGTVTCVHVRAREALSAAS